jgi:2-keto-myo-inositol isomerase
MLQPQQISLNRIAYPNIGLEDFLTLISELKLRNVELRNDLPGGQVTDGMEAERVCELTEQYGISIITINALQRFNLPGELPQARKELENLLALAVSVHCPAIVLCPLNDSRDTRDPKRRFEETVYCLQQYKPMFAEAGVMGYLEPLGFQESSLSSLITSQKAIAESGAHCYRLVHDTFHSHVGPDSLAGLEEELDIGLVALIHASGVEVDLPRERYRDEHRGLVNQADRFQTLRQIEFLLRRGFVGPVSLEPFSRAIQTLPHDRFREEMRLCIDYMLAGVH